MSAPELWMVAMSQAPKGRERKGWFFKFLVVASSRDEAISFAREDYPQYDDCELLAVAPYGRSAQLGAKRDSRLTLD